MLNNIIHRIPFIQDLHPSPTGKLESLYLDVSSFQSIHPRRNERTLLRRKRKILAAFKLEIQRREVTSVRTVEEDIN